ncbi:MAG: adenylate kinase [Desulfobacter sp.]|nr:MAG: adenylate kinase [Desulfobacter sp.]
MKRIAVIGTSCSGKTTFSKALSNFLGYSHIELDGLFWGENWTRRKEFVRDVETCIQKDKWIVEGNYGKVRGAIWQRATTVIFLDLPFHIIFYRAVTRTIKRIITKEQLFSDNVETFKDAFFSIEGIPFWVIKTYRKRKLTYGALKKKDAYSHIDFIQLPSKKAVDQFLIHLKADRAI